LIDGHTFQLLSEQFNGRRSLPENFLYFAEIEHPNILD
jgi:hypothetical protein